MGKKVFSGSRANHAAAFLHSVPLSICRVTLTAVNQLRLVEVMAPALSAAGRFSVLSGIQQVHEITHITHKFLSQ